MRVAFAYPNPRRQLAIAVAAGEAPDTNLFGANHLPALGYETRIRDSFLRRRPRPPGLAHRLTWYGRELTLPWEVGDADVLCTPLATLLPLAARVRRRPKVVLISYHLATAYARAGRTRRALQRAVAGAADRIVSISDEGRRRLRDDVGLDPARLSTATLGVDTGYWHAAPPASDGYVLSVGRDLARDYRTLVNAVSTLPVRTIVAAKEENLRGIELPPNVETRLNVSPREVRELYRGAACVVVPVQAEERRTGTESSGTIALLEAMASARAAVVTDRRFLADYVEPGRTSLTVPPEDPAALREAIVTLLGSPETAAAIGNAARARAEERHTTRHFAERLADVIDGLRV